MNTRIISRPGACSLAILASLAICVALGTALGAKAAAPAAPQADAPNGPSVQVETVRVDQGPIAPRVRAWGSIDFSNVELGTLSLPYAARLTRLAVSNGQPVRKGALLAELTADPSVVAAYVQARSAAAASRDELRRTQALIHDQLATQSQLAAAQKAASDADATLAELDRQGAQPGPRPLNAPFDGVVVNVAAAQGDRLAAGALIMQLGQRGQAAASHVSLGIDPAQARLLQPGASVRISTLEHRGASADATAYEGRLTAVRQVINPQTRLVDASAVLDAGKAPLPFPGTAVAADIDLAASVHWIVPRSAVLDDARGTFLFQVSKGHARRVAVARAVEAGERYGIDGALEPQQPVVVRGNYELADGMAVQEITR